MKMVRHYTLLPFVIYRIALGVVLLALIYSGVQFGAAG
jgi:undecaprenyl pyrophosphate phosphatase UppP